jgi:protein phosphatase
MTSSIDAPRFFFDGRMSSGEIVSLPVGEAAVFSRSSPARSGANEDAAVVFAAGPGRAVLAVADGAGGGPAGEEASRLVLRELHASVAGSDPQENGLREAVLRGFDRANSAVLALGVGAHSTLAVATVEGDVVRAYHAGDSEILVFGQRGRLKLQTVSHSPVGYLAESGYFDEKETMHHEDRHIVSNMVGSPEMKIELGPVMRLSPRDTLVVATDGLVDNLYLEEIVERARIGPLSLAVTRLVEECERRMSSPVEGRPSKVDDLTFILFRPRAGGRK